MALDALRAPEYLVCAVPGAGDQGKLNLVDRLILRQLPDKHIQTADSCSPK
jgi:hypothetical protein